MRRLVASLAILSVGLVACSVDRPVETPVPRELSTLPSTVVSTPAEDGSVASTVAGAPTTSTTVRPASPQVAVSDAERAVDEVDAALAEADSALDAAG